MVQEVPNAAPGPMYRPRAKHHLSQVCARRHSPNGLTELARPVLESASRPAPHGFGTHGGNNTHTGGATPPAALRLSLLCGIMGTPASSRLGASTALCGSARLGRVRSEHATHSPSGEGRSGARTTPLLVHTPPPSSAALGGVRAAPEAHRERSLAARCAYSTSLRAFPAAIVGVSVPQRPLPWLQRGPASSEGKAAPSEASSAAPRTPGGAAVHEVAVDPPETTLGTWMWPLEHSTFGASPSRRKARSRRGRKGPWAAHTGRRAALKHSALAAATTPTSPGPRRPAAMGGMAAMVMSWSHVSSWSGRRRSRSGTRLDPVKCDRYSSARGPFCRASALSMMMIDPPCRMCGGGRCADLGGRGERR